MKRNNSTDEVQIKSYPWYLDDWFASETRASFNLAERGLYREMLVADDHLIIELPGMGKRPLSAKSERVFYMRGTIIEFVKDERGAVSHLIMHVAEADSKAVRKSSAASR